ncbi:MAG: UDP-3-O-(3-hydroxymyristoyl)glucosamine N-acyltransferase [Gammaproteobacteria bacterium]|nr:UDP-3-O-(3-hydroxymyristoyl)glucosamine N-acyltransferase [Gammaproteobacteria bacterium]MBQ0839004.1 UDP-3-O-(3-hydroxymyristoyl)glucosamine N-acyltransferase [Gammaproteobacteria bacterium]
MSATYSLQEIADYLGAELRGDPACRIQRLNTLEQAGEGELSFLASKAYERYLGTTEASAVLVDARFADALQGNALIIANPYVAYARISAWFDRSAQPLSGIHPTAVVAGSAVLADAVSIGPHATIGERVRIDAGVIIGPGVSIGNDTTIGSGSRLHSNVSVYHGVSIGRNAVIHSSTVIGADGFGFANDGGKWVKIHQLGGVEIGDNVEIGACTTIDRGALGNTVIDDGVILDNHVQIAHNVHIGENTAMAAYSAIAGSTTVGKNCVFAGQAGAVGHISVGDGVVAMARCTISKSTSKAGSYSSGLLMYETPVWRRNAVRFGQLDDMAKRLKKLEKNSLEKDKLE